MPSKKMKFQSAVEGLGPSGAWTKIHIPFDVEKQWGSKGRVSVRGTINGFKFESSIFPNGDGSHHMMLNKAILTGAKLKTGDAARVAMEADTTPRVYHAPSDLVQAMKKSLKAKTTWEAFPPGKKKYVVQWLEQAKKAETRTARISKAIAFMEKGKSPLD